MPDEGNALAPNLEPAPSALGRLGRMVLALVMRFPIWTAIGVFALGGFLLRDVLSGSVRDLKVGDCFDVPTAGTSVKDVQHHPCSDSHDAEMLYLGSLSTTSATYPGDKAFKDFVIANCPPAYKAYVGQEFTTQRTYDINWFYPTESSWAKGDRAVNCFVVRLDGKRITTGSVRAKQ